MPTVVISYSASQKLVVSLGQSPQLRQNQATQLFDDLGSFWTLV